MPRRSSRAARAALALLGLTLVLAYPAYAAAAEAQPAPPPAAAPAAKAPEKLDVTKLLPQVGPAVVTVVAYNDDEKEGAEKQGSGFIVDENGTIVTALHVIAGATSVLVKLRNGAFFLVDGVTAWDEKLDFAALTVKGMELPVLHLGSAKTVKQGSRVIVVGSPKGLEQTASEGIVSALRGEAGERELLQVTAPMSPGSSGGPVLNEAGEVIGAAIMQVQEGQNLNFAVPVDPIKAALSAPHKLTTFDELVRQGIGMTAEELCAAGVRKRPSENDDDTTTKTKWEQALVLFRKAVEKDPSYCRSHLEIAACLTGLGREEEALAAGLKARDLGPDLALTHSELGCTYADLDRWEEATKCFEQAVKLEPKEADYHARLATAYGHLGRTKDEDKEYRAAVALAPEDVRHHRSLALTLEDEKQFEEALKEYRVAEKLTPEDPMLQVAMARCLHELGRGEERDKACLRALELNRDNDMFLRLFVAVQYVHAKHWKEALAMYEKMTQVDDEKLTGLLGLGETYAAMGKYEESEKSYQSAREVNPKSAAAYSGLGNCYLAQNRLKEAVEMYEQALRLYPDSAEAHFGLGACYLRQNDRASALQEYKILKEKDAETAEKLFKLLYPPARGKSDSSRMN